MIETAVSQYDVCVAGNLGHKGPRYAPLAAWFSEQLCSY